MFWAENNCLGHWRISIKKKLIFFWVQDSHGCLTLLCLEEIEQRSTFKQLSSKKETTGMECNLEFRWPSKKAYPCEAWPYVGGLLHYWRYSASVTRSCLAPYMVSQALLRRGNAWPYMKLRFINYQFLLANKFPREKSL